MTISNTIESIEIISSTQKRKRWTAMEKRLIVQETYLPGATVSYMRSGPDPGKKGLNLWIN
jgi:hypothetical protein